ncbi:1-deoxy-D-xylulose-5-phosphate synthase [Clostridiales bacterium]|nr:transketolase family protein [Clostridiales bacterium]GFI55898.1 1-deoxy-D-xylulose-5-phosphate synthase [Clostridiales bacterium]
MADMIATRDAYGKALVEFGAQYDNLVVLDADLAAATKTEMFKKAYPDRFFDCGIAENNMIGVASGLALSGKIPFASSFAMFAAGRSFEQVRNSVGYPGTNVKIGATHGGITVGEDGATHQCLEDFALMRTIPGMTVICPADAGEARLAVQAAIEYNGPVYLRFGRMAVPVLYDNSYAFSIGKGSRLVEGNDVSLIANGVEVEQALVAAELLKADGIHASVVNMATIKPLDQEMVLEEAKRCGCIVTCEEHSVIGGLGAAVCEFLSETMPTPVLRVGTNDCYGRSGSAKVLLSLFGLDAAAICEKAKAAIQMKK